jgi:hypothetical protein
MVKSVSWPMPAMTGIPVAQMARATSFFVEGPEVFDAAAATAEDDCVAIAGGCLAYGLGNLLAAPSPWTGSGRG